MGPSPLNVCPEREAHAREQECSSSPKKSHLLIHLGITLLFLLLPLFLFCRMIIILVPRRRGRNDRNPSSPPQRGHIRSLRVRVKLPRSPRFLFWKMTPCAARGEHISSGCSKCFPSPAFFCFTLRVRTLVDRSYEDVCFFAAGSKSYTEVCVHEHCKESERGKSRKTTVVVACMRWSLGGEKGKQQNVVMVSPRVCA